MFNNDRHLFNALCVCFYLQHQTLIPHILRCDVEKVKSILLSLEQEQGTSLLESLCLLRSVQA